MKIKAYVKEHGILCLILLLAAAVRLIGIGKIPGGVLPDEAYGAYNAWSLLNEGIDSRGYHFPVYFVAWGSGMSVLYSYLAIPLFALFGATTVVYRLPQAIIGILGVYAAYVLGKEILDKRFGLLFALVLAINPWNIMNTRFGLDANMAPDMLLIAVTLLVLAVGRSRSYFLPAAITLGLTLYCYALSWIVIPVFLLLFLLVYRKRIPFGRKLVAATVVLFIMACPLLYFVGVNLGIFPEVQTAFFSIPRLMGFRGEELNLVNVLSSLKTLGSVLLKQYDDVSYTACRETGAYYYFTTPFWILGIGMQLVALFRDREGEKRSLEYVMLLWFISAGIMCALNSNITVIHSNLIHIPVIFYGAYGIYQIGKLLKNKVFSAVCLCTLLLSFGVFLGYYVQENKTSSYFFDEDATEAITRAREVSENGEFTIVKPQTINFAVILWNEKIPASEFISTVVYTGDIGWQSTESFQGFHYVQNLDDVTEDGVYLIPCRYEEEMQYRNYEIVPVNGTYSLAVRQTQDDSGHSNAE